MHFRLSVAAYVIYFDFLAGKSAMQSTTESSHYSIQFTWSGALFRAATTPSNHRIGIILEPSDGSLVDRSDALADKDKKRGEREREREQHIVVPCRRLFV